MKKSHKTLNFKVIKFIIGYAASVDKGLGFSNAKYNVLTVCKDDKNPFETANQFPYLSYVKRKGCVWNRTTCDNRAKA